MDILLLGLVFDIYSVLCSALDILMQLFLSLANLSTSIIDLESIMRNIYVLMSVIMIFYATITLMTYLVSPNKISDSSSGGSKLLIKIIITLTLLVFTPTLFSLSRDLQTAILEENIIGKIILSSSTKMDEDTFANSTHTMITTLTKAFLRPVKDNTSDSLYMEPFFTSGVKSMSQLKVYAEDTANYSFNWALAIVSVVILCLTIFGFLFDISIRLIKLLFMEIIAPIPILCYPLPKKQSVFSNWLSNTLSAYASLFIRLLLIYFALFCIQNIDSSISDVSNGHFLLHSFVIIGILLFAKQLPQLISDMFGIKMDGKFSLNPMDRIREVPLLGNAAHTAAGAVGGMITGGALGFRQGGIKGMAKSGALGMLVGGRAGFNQVGLGGIDKSQRPKTMAYNAGASSVAQAITGNDKANSGIVNRAFNMMNTELNKPVYNQGKAIETAQNTLEKDVSQLNALKDSEIEITSKYDTARSQKIAFSAQSGKLGAEIDELRLNNTIEVNEVKEEFRRKIASAVAQSDDVIKSKQSGIVAQMNQIKASIPTQVAEFEANCDLEVSAVMNSRPQRITRATAAIDTQLSNLYSQFNAALDSGDGVTAEKLSNDISMLENRKSNISQEVIVQETNEVNQILQRKANANVIIQETVNSQLSELQQRYDNVRGEVYSEIDSLRAQEQEQIRDINSTYEQKINVITNEKATIDQKLSEVVTVEKEYSRQAQNISSQVRQQQDKVARDEQNLSDQKDKRNDMLGPYN